MTKVFSILITHVRLTSSANIHRRLISIVLIFLYATRHCSLSETVYEFHQIEHHYDAHNVRVAFLAGIRRCVAQILSAVAETAKEGLI